MSTVWSFCVRHTLDLIDVPIHVIQEEIQVRALRVNENYLKDREIAPEILLLCTKRYNEADGAKMGVYVCVRVYKYAYMHVCVFL